MTTKGTDKLPDRLPKTYRCSIEVRGYELDSYGHVNHAQFVHYLEHARWKMLEEQGVTLEKFNLWKAWPVIAALELKYIKPAFMGQMLEVATEVEKEVGRRTNFYVHQKIYHEGVLILDGKVRSVMVNEKGRPTEIPEEMMKRWEAEK